MMDRSSSPAAIVGFLFFGTALLMGVAADRRWGIDEWRRDMLSHLGFTLLAAAYASLQLADFEAQQRLIEAALGFRSPGSMSSAELGRAQVKDAIDTARSAVFLAIASASFAGLRLGLLAVKWRQRPSPARGA